MKAFPSEDSKWNEYADAYIKVRHPGMDLRDYFATKAMEQVRFQYTSDCKNIQETDAKFCYMIADAMMKAREK